MAPAIALQLAPRRTTYHHSSSNGGAIGGGVVAAIIVIAIIIFIIVFYVEYKKASRIQAQRGIPIPTGRIVLKALFASVTFGLAACLCADCCDDSSDTGGGGGGGGNAQPQMVDQSGLGGGFVSQPQPTYQPQMDYTPISNAAQAPIV